MGHIIPILSLAALVALLVMPKFGLAARWRQIRTHTARVRQEDALKLILKFEANGMTPTLEGVAGALHLRPASSARLLSQMEKLGLVSFDQGGLRLRPAGRDIAIHVIRAHRLWESFLADQTGIDENQWHSEAEKQEHLLSEAEADALAAQLGHPAFDPHGDAIPEPGGRLEADNGMPLNAAQTHVPMRISHIEDEPKTVHAQLSAQGLHRGMLVTISEKSSERIRFWADGEEQVLAPSLANNISVAPLPAGENPEMFGGDTLSELRPGRTSRVLGLSPGCLGPERRRLLDLGFVPGTRVTAELVSPGGDPTAYTVRGTLIALRREQARMIRIASAAEASA